MLVFLSKAPKERVYMLARFPLPSNLTPWEYYLPERKNIHDRG